MRTMLSNLLEKTAIMRVLSGNSPRMSGNTVPVPGDIEPKTGNMSAKTEDIPQKSPDPFAMAGDLGSSSGNKRTMLPDSTGMFGVITYKFRDMPVMLLGMTRTFGNWLRCHFERRRAARRARQARMAYLETLDFDDLFVIEYIEVERSALDEMILAAYLARPLAVDLPTATRRTILAILLAFAHGLLGLFSSVARTVVNWQTPLHRRATRIPRGSRPPPAWAATWSIC